MDTIWLSAPGLAIKLWQEAGRACWRANPALLDWSARRGVAEEHWPALVAELQAACDTDPAPELAFCGARHRVTPAALGDGSWLCWLDPLPAEASARPTDATRWLVDMLHLAQEFGRMALFDRNIRTGEARWSPQMFKLYGIEPSHQLPSVAEAIQALHPDDRDSALQAWADSVRAPGHYEHRYRIVDAQGEVRHIHGLCEVRAGADGQPELMLGCCIDDSETVRRTQAERAHASVLAHRIEMITQAAGIGFWTRDLITRTSEWDAQMYRLRGVEPDCGMTPEELRRSSHHPEDAVELDRKFAEAELRGVDYEHEFRVTWPDGSVRWLATRCVARRDDGGKLIGLSGFNWDITQHKLAQRALHERATLEQSSRAKSEFMSRMSHELRTPLNAVLGFAQMMRRDAGAPLPASQDERVGHIEAAGTHLMSLIDDVLDLAAVESDRLSLHIEPTDLRAAVDDVLRWTLPQIQAAGVQVHLDPMRAWVKVDRRRLRQIIANLLTNAVKYNRPGGEVWISTMPHPVHGGDGWQLRVRDSGRGMSAEQQAHLFEPFNRLGAEREGIEGTGVGLTIVRHLLDRMGGSVAVRSAPGQGSEFRVAFPACAEPLAQPLPASDAAGGDSARLLSVLYIEDNAVNALLVAQALSLRPNMRLLSAVDGASGVALAREQRPDVVLVDMQLPDFDGYEVLQRLRSDGAAGPAFIALSASAMPEDVLRAKAAGFIDYWTKPIDLGRFLAGLDALAASRP
jgi:PAS domain S-box-containing protein